MDDFDGVPFEAIAQYVGAGDALNRASQSTKLYFYALYKTYREGPAPQIDVFRRLSLYFFDPVAFKKWSAWDLVSTRYRTADACCRRYCRIAQELGAFPTESQLAVMKITSKSAGRQSAMAKEETTTIAPAELDALIDACEHDDDGYVRFYASQRGDLNIKTSEGSSLLHFAADTQAIEVLKLLLGMPSLDVDAVDDQGQSALHLTAINGQDWQAVGQLLLNEGGADPQLKDLAGQTPVDILHEAGLDVSLWSS